MTANFTNILQAAFSYQSSLRTFYVLTIWVCIFWQKDFGAKAAHKMLVKLTPGRLKFYTFNPTLSFPRHDTQYNGIQHNDIRPNDTRKNCKQNA